MRYFSASSTADGTGAASARVEQAHFDERVAIERKIARVEAHRIDVVEQQSHPNATVRRGDEGAAQDLPGDVGFPVIVLKIEASTGLFDGLEPRVECGKVVGQKAQPGLSRPFGNHWANHLINDCLAGCGWQRPAFVSALPVL